MRLCEEWPVDKEKVGRDLGELLHKRVFAAFRQGENTQLESSEWECDRFYGSLQKINANHYNNLYQRKAANNCTGFSVEDCRLLTSSETVAQLGQLKLTLRERVKSWFALKVSSAAAQN